MAKPGLNEGFHVLDDFICEAIHHPSIPLADSSKQGRNEGMSVVKELEFDAGKQPASLIPDAIKAEVHRLATFISSSSDPLGATALVQKFLLAEIDSIQKNGNSDPGMES